MTAVPVRTVHRLKQALTAEHETQPFGQKFTFAYTPHQFLMGSRKADNDVEAWQQTTYGDDVLATSREGSADKPFHYILRSGVQEFETSLGRNLPRPLSITHQHLWWGTPTHHNVTSSPVSPNNVAYAEFPEETFADEVCRVFEAPGLERTIVGQQDNRSTSWRNALSPSRIFHPFFTSKIS